MIIGVLCEQIIDQLLNDVNHTTGQRNHTSIKVRLPYYCR